jgi:hypothetical protein
MAGFIPAIHVLTATPDKDVDARDIGERSDAVLRTAMPGHDENRESYPFAGKIVPSTSPKPTR